MEFGRRRKGFLPPSGNRARLQAEMSPAEMDAIFLEEGSRTLSLPTQRTLSLRFQRLLSAVLIARLDAVLQRRWVQCGIFVGAVLVFWLLGTRSALA